MAKHTPETQRQQAEAGRAHISAGEKIALQSSGSREKQINWTANNPYLARLWDFDDGLCNEPWFDARTAHMYPKLVEIMHTVDPTHVITRTRQMIDDFRTLDTVASKVSYRLLSCFSASELARFHETGACCCSAC